MKGKYRIVIENKKIKYDFEIMRNLTIIKGDSATGKTTLVDMVAEYYENGEASGIHVQCDRTCAILEGRDWKMAPSFAVPILEGRELQDIFFKLRLDCPELFWAVGFRYRYFPNASNVEMIPEYLFDKKNVYYSPAFDVVIVAKKSEGKLTCYDIFGKTTADLREILGTLVPEEQYQVVLFSLYKVLININIV